MLLIAALLLNLSTTAPTQQRVRALTVEGTIAEGQWSGVEKTSAILLEDGRQRELPLRDLMSLRWPAPATSRPAASQPAMPRVYLDDGGEFDARILGGNSRSVRLDTSLAGELELPMTDLVAIRFAKSGDSGAAEAFQTAIHSRDPSQDTLVLLREGRVSTVRGAVEMLTADGGSFRWRERSIPLNRQTLYAIVFAAGVSTPPAAPVLCRLHDGSAWGGTLTGGDTQVIRLTLSSGAEARIPVDEVVEVRFRSDRVRFLSELQPASYEFEPFVSTRWPYRMDRAVTSEPMRLGQQVIDRGIGMHSQSRLTFELPERYTQLAATIGIDDAVRPLGSVVFRVLADGREVFNSGPVTGRDAPRPILVPIDGAKTLQLAVDFGEDLDIADHADWGSARLIK